LLFWFSFLHAQKRLERQLNRSIAKDAVFQGTQVSVSVFDLDCPHFIIKNKMGAFIFGLLAIRL
jgi:hypothetical protein